MIDSWDIMMTRNCNLRCEWCFIKEHTSCPDPGEVDRNLATFWWIIDYYKSCLGENTQPKGQWLEIGFFGGEPVCAWESVKALVKARKKCGLKRIWFYMVSNLSLLTPEKADWCRKHKIGILASVDGCPEAIDFYRRTPAGGTVSDAVIRHARYLLNIGWIKKARSTIAPDTVQWAHKSVRYLAEEVGFKEIHQIVAGGVNWTDEAIAELKRQTEMTTDWWVANMRQGRHYVLHYMQTMLEGIWNPIRPRHQCGAGRHHAAIDTDGTIYPCHRFTNSTTKPEYRLGNIHGGGISNRALQRLLATYHLAQYHKERCARCPAVNACYALCYSEAMEAGLGMFDAMPHFCKIQPFFYSEALRAHALLTAERNELYLKLYAPRQCRSA